MSYFVGIDVSLEESSICVVNNDADEILEKSGETSPDSIIDAIADF